MSGAIDMVVKRISQDMDMEVVQKEKHCNKGEARTTDETKEKD